MWYNVYGDVMEDIFLKNLPRIDLHGYDKESARVATNDFISENLLLKNEKIVIVHGKGTGQIKTEVHNTLRQRKEVVNYYTYYNNEGCTIVHLMLDN